MEANIIEKKLIYIQCPKCDDQNSHCISGVERGTSFGPWYCARCGAGIMGSISSRGIVDICETQGRKDPTYVLMRIESQNAPVFLVVEGSEVTDLSTGKTRADSDESDAFLYKDEIFYNYECPPSITMQKVVAVIKNGDDVLNPREMLQYVATRPAPRDSADDEKEEYAVRVFQDLLYPVPGLDETVPASQQISR